MLLKKKIGINKIRKKFENHCSNCKYSPKYNSKILNNNITCYDYLVYIYLKKPLTLIMSTAYFACSYMNRNYYYEDDF